MKKAIVWDRRTQQSAGNKGLSAAIAALVFAIPSEYWLQDPIPVIIVSSGTVVITFIVDRIVSKYFGVLQ